MAFLTSHDQWTVVQVMADAIDVPADYPRRDLGNLDPLRDSIAQVGLLAPIVVDPDFVLKFGLRRLAVCRDLLGWRTVPVLVTDTLDEPVIAALGWRDENTARKALAPSEAVAVARQIEELVAPMAAARMVAGVKAAVDGPGYGRKLGVVRGPGGVPIPDPPATWPEGGRVGRESREIAASATGYSATSLRRAAQLLSLVDDESLPRSVRERVAEQVRIMDATGEVAGPLRRAKQAVAGAGEVAGPQVPAVRRAWALAATATTSLASALRAAHEALACGDGDGAVVDEADLDQVRRAAEQALVLVERLRQARSGLSTAAS